MHTQKKNFVAFFSKETATIVLECQSSLQEKKEDANMVEEERTLEEKWNNHKQGVSNHQTLNFSGTSGTSTPSIFIPNLADHRPKLIYNDSEAIMMQHLRFFTKRNREQY